MSFLIFVDLLEAAMSKGRSCSANW